MPELNKPLTASELIKMRNDMKRTPYSVSCFLGVNVNTYYRWERDGGISKTASLAMRLLSAQPSLLDGGRESAPDCKPLNRFRESFAPGARFGGLEVTGRVPSKGMSCHRKVAVRCDCGWTQTLRASELLKMVKCGPHCSAASASANLPAPTPKPARPRRNAHKTEPMPETAPAAPLDLDGAPDLDASPEEWSAYHLTKLQATTATAATTTVAEEDEWEDGL